MIFCNFKYEIGYEKRNKINSKQALTEVLKKDMKTIYEEMRYAVIFKSWHGFVLLNYSKGSNKRVDSNSRVD